MLGEVVSINYCKKGWERFLYFPFLQAVTDVRYDLDDYARDDFFRAYTTDFTLLVAMKDFKLKQHIAENTLSGNT